MAVATAPGRGGVGVVRVSGAELTTLAEAICGKAIPPRVATYASFRDAEGRLIDQGIALYFSAPRSYTGEDVLELQGHGGPVVLQLLVQRCLELGARLAEPGEFTKRAFLNGKLDLAQAEGVADLIEASSAAAARAAVRSVSGRFSHEITVISESLMELRVLVEATLDFPEEEVDFLERADAWGRIDGIRGQLAALLDRGRMGNLLGRGMNVVLAGRPNAGKSSLLNLLAGDERAIVTEIPGTTRDVLRESIQIEGIPLHVVDTAGLRPTEDHVERLGIAGTWREIGRADVILLLVDAAQGWSQADGEIRAAFPAGVPVVTIMNKVDLSGDAVGREEGPDGVRVYLCARTGAGLDLLRTELLRIVGWHETGEDVFVARERQLQALAGCARHVERAANRQAGLEITAEELRLAHDALAEITGEFTADDLLGQIFSRFCIGK